MKSNKNSLSLFPSIHTSLFSDQSNKNNLSKKIYKEFSFRLFEYNQNSRQKSVNNKNKFQLNQLDNQFNNNIYINMPLTIRHFSKEKFFEKPIKSNPSLIRSSSVKNKIIKDNIHQKLIIKKPLTRNYSNKYNSILNLGLVPLKRKKEKYNNLFIQNNFLSDEDTKNNINNLQTKFDNKRKKNKINNYLTNNKYNNDSEDDYSDCESLKGLIIGIKQKISENKFKVNKTFNQFDKQILQDQYLIERFYIMKKNASKNNKIKYLRNKFRNKQKKFDINNKYDALNENKKNDNNNIKNEKIFKLNI